MMIAPPGIIELLPLFSVKIISCHKSRENVTSTIERCGVDFISAFLISTPLIFTTSCRNFTSTDETDKEYRTTEYSTGDYVDDAAVTSKVRMAILQEKGLDGSKISIETTNGVVQLKGTVESESAEQRIIEIASNIKGVKVVQEDLRVD